MAKSVQRAVRFSRNCQRHSVFETLTPAFQIKTSFNVNLFKSVRPLTSNLISRSTPSPRTFARPAPDFSPPGQGRQIGLQPRFSARAGRAGAARIRTLVFAGPVKLALIVRMWPRV